MILHRLGLMAWMAGMAAGPLRAAAEGGYLKLDNSLTYSWRSFPPLFRLLVAGTGTCVLDSMNSSGTITLGVESYTVTDSKGDVFYPYPGDDAVAVRANLSGCAAEMI